MNYDAINYDEMTDEEIEEMFDTFIDSFKDDLLGDDTVSVTSPDRARAVLFVYNTLKRSFSRQSNIKVTYALNEPFVSMGSVTVSGKNIEFKKPKLFMKAVEASDNFEVYPKTDGTVDMNFTFHNLTIQEDKNE